MTNRPRRPSLLTALSPMQQALRLAENSQDQAGMEAIVPLFLPAFPYTMDPAAKEKLLQALKTTLLKTLDVIWKLAVIALLVVIVHTQCHAADDRLANRINTVCDTRCVEADLLRFALHQGSAETRIDPLWFLAVIEIESGYRAHAVNRKNGRSVGLSQIQVRWHRDKFTSRNYADVFENVRVGMMILRECRDKYDGNMRKALHCYNGHQPGGLKRYSDRVAKIYHQLRQEHISV